MTTIFIVGSNNDCELEYLIKSRLSESYEISYIRGDSFLEAGAGYNLIVFENESPIINAASGIVLVKENGAVPKNLPKGIIAIINADDENQLKDVQEKHVPVITCGTPDTSTISCTSETEEMLMISLNRSLKALSGRTIEPLEIPVEKGSAGRYSLMSYTALRLLLDDFNSELGNLI